MVSEVAATEGRKGTTSRTLSDGNRASNSYRQ